LINIRNLTDITPGAEDDNFRNLALYGEVILVELEGLKVTFYTKSSSETISAKVKERDIDIESFSIYKLKNLLDIYEFVTSIDLKEIVQ